MSNKLTEMEALELDAQSLRPEELSMPALMRELNLQKKPAWVLVKLMNALEQKRQRKGLGWSRAWNKYGLTVFRTHTLRPELDADFLAPSMSLLNHFLIDAPASYRSFVADLLCDPSRMAFVFYHNHSAGEGRQYEGLTISVGRRVPNEPSKRDRLDIVLEDERVNGSVDGRVDRVRIYVCPWSTYGEDRLFHLVDRSCFSATEVGLLRDCYDVCVDRYNLWKMDEGRQWSHWSARYIDYFGPRDFIPWGSSFI